MRGLPPLKGLLAFRAVMETGSFATAAETLGLTPSAVSHQVRSLEQLLQLRLFERRNRRVFPTSAATTYHAALNDGFSRIESATEQLAGAKPDVRLTIHSTPSFATNFLMPRLPDFIRRFADIDVMLSSGVGPVRLGPEGYLIDIQHMRSPPQGCDAIDLAEELIVPLASPTFASTNGLNHPEAIGRARLIHSLRCPTNWTEWALRHAPSIMPSRRGMQFDRSFLALTAASDGLGLALESTLLAREMIKSGRLILPFGPLGDTAIAHRLIHRREDRREPHIQAFVSWIVAELAEAQSHPPTLV